MHKNSVVVYHKDQDGLAAAYPFMAMRPTFVEFTHPLFENTLNHDILARTAENGIVYFLDCAPPPGIANRIAKNSKVVILDHHATAAQDYNSFKNLSPEVIPHFLTDRCGAILADEFAEKNPQIFKNDNRIDCSLLQIIDMADRNMMRTREDNHRVSFMDCWLSSTNRIEVFGKLAGFNQLSHEDKQGFHERMLADGRQLYEENLTIAKKRLDRNNLRYAALGLPRSDARFYAFIPVNPHERGGREVSRMACELAEETNSIVFLYCKRDGLINLSVRTGSAFNAGQVARQLAAYGSLNSGGGGETMGCIQYFSHEFEHLFKFHAYGRQVAHNLKPESYAVILADTEPGSVTKHFPRSPHSLAKPYLG